jgi:hypothetical protein
MRGIKQGARLKLALVVMGLALFAAGSASAFVTAPAPGTWQSLTRCLTTGSVSVSSGQYLRIGWGSITEAQSYDFLAAQSGSLTISNTSGVAAQWAWPTGDTSFWTQPALVSAPGNQINGGRPIWFTGAFFQVNLAPGSYTISMTTSISRAVYDGSDVYKKGSSWFSVSGCTLTVT